MVIEIGKSKNEPIVKCPHCTKQQLIDIVPFREDVTRIMSDKCRHCGGEIVVSMLILCDTDMRSMLQTIQAVVATINKSRLQLGGQRG